MITTINFCKCLLLSLFTALFIIPALAISLPNAIVNASNADSPITLCVASPDWTQPSWPIDILTRCQELINILVQTEPEILISSQIHEFLPKGIRPSRSSFVRTPWRLSHGACTLAITTLGSIPAERIPHDVGPGPFGSRGYSSWFKIFDDASAVLKNCVENRKAGMSWSPKFGPGLGIFIYATDSMIDTVIGPGVNGDFILPPGVNVTNGNTATNGSSPLILPCMDVTSDNTASDVSSATS